MNRVKTLRVAVYVSLCLAAFMAWPAMASTDHSFGFNTVRHSFHDGVSDGKIKTYPSVHTIRDYTVPSLRSEVRSKGFKWGRPAFIRIFKQENTLEVWLERDGAFKGEYGLFKTYDICKYSGGLGPKFKQGDEQAPEGFYSVTEKRLNPNSRYYLSFNIGFPNAFDRAHGRTGTVLMVHGGCESKGCYAMTNAKMAEIYMIVEAALKKGQESVPVHIFPFRMTDENMAKHQGNTHHAFWRNLQEGYEYFEATSTPPSITVENAKYVLENPLNPPTAYANATQAGQ